MHPWLTPVCRTSSEVNCSRGRGLARYVVAVGTLSALVTGPGPILHNTLVGKGTPLADAATSVYGQEPDLGAHREHAPEHPALSAGILRVAVNVPSYSLLTLASVLLMRAATRVGRRDLDRSSQSSRSGKERANEVLYKR